MEKIEKSYLYIIFSLFKFKCDFLFLLKKPNTRIYITRIYNTFCLRIENRAEKR